MREVGALLKSRPCLLRSDQRTPEPVRIQTPQRRCVGTTHRVGETGPRPEHPLEGQTSTRVDSDVTHSPVPSSPPRRSEDPTIRRSDGRARTERFVDTRLSRGVHRRGGAAHRSLASPRPVRRSGGRRAGGRGAVRSVRRSGGGGASQRAARLSRSAGHTAETGARGPVRRCDRPAHPLEGQTSTRTGSDVTHSLVPTTPPRPAPTFRRAGGHRAVRRYAAFQGSGAKVVLHFDLSRPRPRCGRMAASARRACGPAVRRNAIRRARRSSDGRALRRCAATAVLRAYGRVARRAVRSGDAAERDPTGGTRFVWCGVAAGGEGGARREGRAGGATDQNTPRKAKTATRIDMRYLARPYDPAPAFRRSDGRADGHRAVRRHAASQGGARLRWCCTSISGAPTAAPVGSPLRRDVRAVGYYVTGRPGGPLSAIRRRDGAGEMRTGAAAERDLARETRCGGGEAKGRARRQPCCRAEGSA